MIQLDWILDIEAPQVYYIGYITILDCSCKQISNAAMQSIKLQLCVLKQNSKSLNVYRSVSLLYTEVLQAGAQAKACKIISFDVLNIVLEISQGSLWAAYSSKLLTNAVKVPVSKYKSWQN